MTRHNYYKLRDGETVIGGTDDAATVFDVGGFLLTSQRVIHIKRPDLKNQAGLRSVDLEKVDEIEFLNVKIWLYLIFSLAIFGLLLFVSENSPSTNDNIPEIILLCGSVGYFMQYLATKKREIRIFTSDGLMILDAKDMSDESIQDLIEEIDLARSRRIEELAMIDQVAHDRTMLL